MKNRTLERQEQEELVATVHQIDKVIEVYLNKSKRMVTELSYQSNQKVHVYQHNADDYLEQTIGITSLKEEVASSLRK